MVGMTAEVAGGAIVPAIVGDVADDGDGDDEAVVQALTIIVSPRTDARTDQIRRSDIAISLSRVISGVESRTS